MPITYERELNPEQLDVVRSGDGPCLVLAGAGSGKTRTIVYRVAHLLDAGVLPQQILLLTFTNKAAREMLSRVEQLLSKIGPTPSPTSLKLRGTSRSPSPREGEKEGVSPPPVGRGGVGGWAISHLWGGTFHHVANRVLRRYAPVIGYQNNFSILDEEDSQDLLKLCVKDVGVATTEQRFPAPRVLKSVISLSRNSQRELREVLGDRHPKFMRVASEVEAVAQRYDARKRAANAMDFDDLLVNLLRLLTAPTPSRSPSQGEGEKVNISPPPAGRGGAGGWGRLSGPGHQLSQQFRYVLVDEYQDTNRIQAAIVARLASVHQNLLVVGDDAQSIYSFRAADVGNILEFPRQWPACRTFRIETNYRSSPQILNVANAAIAANEAQFPKTLRPVQKRSARPQLIQAHALEDEAQWVAKQILALRDDGVPLPEIAVLFRATHLSEFLEMELVKRDIPYDYRGGIRFFERAHVKDVLAFLKVLVNPSDEAAWLRVLRMQEGIGDVGAMSVIERIKAAARGKTSGVAAGGETPGVEEPTVDVKERAAWPSTDLTLPPRLQPGWRSFLEMVKPMLTPYALRLTPEPAALIRALAAGSYRDHLETEYPNWEERLEDLEQLALFAEKYTDPAEFLADTSLQELFGAERVGANASDQERVVLSTIHQAKGLEWRAVFVIGMTAASFPNRRALLEEGGVEEERRLFYVAITRAKERLSLSYALSGGVESSFLRAPSPFLSEIPSELLESVNVSRVPSSRRWRERGDDSEPIIVLDAKGERTRGTGSSAPKRNFLRDVSDL